MTKIDIFSGFLGAGKTTLIKKLINEAYKGEKLVLIENEFGEIGIDGGFLKDAGIEITEMNSGCICCSLVGDFGEALKKVLEQFSPDRILIEPSGVGKLSDVIRAVQDAGVHGASLNSYTTVVDAKKCKMYMKNFGEFFNNQVENAGCIVLSHTAGMSEDKLKACVELLRGHNASATIITTDWDSLEGVTILEAMEHRNTLEEELKELAADHEDACPVCGHHHDHDEEHGHHHHDHEDHDHCCHDEESHEHHHHEDEDHHHCCHDHEHNHDHECSCGHDHDHNHDHEHHHHADEVFTSWGVETTHSFTRDEIEAALEALTDESKYGIILRAKGIVSGADGKWIHFDYVPGEPDVRSGSAGVTGRLCVIGSKINEAELQKLFHVA